MQLNYADTLILEYVDRHPNCTAKDVIEDIPELGGPTGGYAILIPLVGSGLLHWGTDAARARLTVTAAGRAAMGWTVAFEISLSVVITPANWFGACLTSDHQAVMHELRQLAVEAVRNALLTTDQTARVRPNL